MYRSVESLDSLQPPLRRSGGIESCAAPRVVPCVAPPLVLDPLPRAVLCYLTERARCFFTRRHIALHVTATKQELDYALVGLLSRGHIVRVLGLYGVLRTADEVPTFDAVEESLEQEEETLPALPGDEAFQSVLCGHQSILQNLR